MTPEFNELAESFHEESPALPGAAELQLRAQWPVRIYLRTGEFELRCKKAWLDASGWLKVTGRQGKPDNAVFWYPPDVIDFVIYYNDPID